MTTERMNVHKALCELKILDERIRKVIMDCEVVGVKKVAANMVGSQTVEDFKIAQRAAYDKAVDLIRRRTAIKRAVVLSNAVTKVVVCGEEHTVAEAIEMKNHGMENKEALRNRIASRTRGAEDNAILANNDAERRADMYMKDLVGGKDVKSDEIKTIREGYLAGLLVEVIDPLPGGAKKILKDLSDEIDGFMVEVDSALSTSNALTEIEISY